MSRDQIIDKAVNLVQVKLGRRVRIHHRRVVDMLPITGQGGLYRQSLHIDIRLHGCGQLRRQDTDVGRLDAICIDQTGNLDATPNRQILD